jgi:cell division protein FtsI (penicillin-binding protein 3)
MAGQERSRRLGSLSSRVTGFTRAHQVQGDWRATVRSRLAITAAAFALWTAGIEARLLYLQVFQHAELVARAERQRMQTLDAPAKRGDIIDRNGRLLAYSVDAESLWADPTQVVDIADTANQICAALDACSKAMRAGFVEDLRRRERAGRLNQFVWLQRKISPGEEQRIRELKLPGIGFLKESRRFYPNKEMLAHVLGYVGMDNAGLAGLESTYDSQIRGLPGRVIVETDARERAVFSRVEREATAGASIELTVDQNLQNIAERELRTGVLENRATGGTAIVMDPWTGEVLALANYPTFNPNVYARSAPEVRRNRATQEIYEPGSTFKIVTASAALEERVVAAHDLVDCAPGVIRFGARAIRDVHTYGVLPFSEVIAKSSNVGAIRVGQRLGAERLGVYINRFGFGKKTGQDFIGETGGIVWSPANLDASALASVSIGYQVSVTPLQMAVAVSSIANGGTLFQPRIVRAVLENGRRSQLDPHPLRRTVSERTAAEITGMMEGVVEDGTAKPAQIEGYTIAGKTGTAQKLVSGAYSDSDYNASFVGFFPSRKPALTVVVVIDTPRSKGHYGGTVAGPIFKRIAEASIRYLGITPTINPAPPILLARQPAAADILSTRPVRVDPNERMPLPTRSGVMPDLRGLGAREAVRVLTAAGMSARISGDGFVIEQSPAAGSELQPGITCAVKLGRRPPGPAGAAVQ